MPSQEPHPSAGQCPPPALSTSTPEVKPCDASASEVQQTQMIRAKGVLTKGGMKTILYGARMCR